MTFEPGRVAALWRKRVKRGPMDPLGEAELAAGRGLVGNAQALGGKRQVTLIEAERWDDVRAELGVALDPALRRANLLIRGLPLAESRGRVLLVGPCRLLVHGETRPCRLMEDTWPGLQAALAPDWRGGVYAEILAGGRIALGDRVVWEELGLPLGLGGVRPD